MLLDHIFIITSPGAPAAEKLVELGFVEGNANVHPGQGTSNRRFFLSDFTIELLYVSNAQEAANGAGKDLGILARARDSSTCPFGIVVRTPDAETNPDFPSWQYTPDYFGGRMCFYVGENSGLLQEPLCICMPPALPRKTNIPAEYKNPNWELSKLEITVPVEKPSPVLQQFSHLDRVSIKYENQHKMTLEFNNGVSNTFVDLSPELPLTIAH